MTVLSAAEIAAAPPPETRACAVSNALALAATLTVTVIGGKLAPPTKASSRVQVAPEHDHPAPNIASNERPVGRVSVTMIGPDVGPALVAFVTAIEYTAPAWPC